MGERPENKTLDRIDVNGNYCKENCRWATVEQQSSNKRTNVYILWEGKKQTIMQWAKELNLCHSTISRRYKKIMINSIKLK